MERPRGPDPVQVLEVALKETVEHAERRERITNALAATPSEEGSAGVAAELSLDVSRAMAASCEVWSNSFEFWTRRVAQGQGQTQGRRITY